INIVFRETEWSAVRPRGLTVCWANAAADDWRKSYRGIAAVIRRCRESIGCIRNIQTVDDCCAVPTIFDFEPKFQLLVGGQHGALEVSANGQQKGSLALNKSVSLNTADDGNAERAHGNPPSESNHSVWVAERLFPKPLLRFYILLATFALGISAQEILFSSHASSLMWC